MKTANEAPIAGATYSKPLQLGGLVASVVMCVAFFALYLPDAKVQECASSAAGTVGTIALVMSVMFGVTIGTYVAQMSFLRLKGYKALAYKLRSFPVGWNHRTHAAHYVMCGVAQIFYVVVAVVFAVSVLTSDSIHCGGAASQAHATLMLLSVVCLAPFIVYKLAAVKACPGAGLQGAQQFWKHKFGADTPVAARDPAKIAPAQ